MVIFYHTLPMGSEASCHWCDIYHTVFIAIVSVAYVSTPILIVNAQLIVYGT